jgi:glycosyltransferase involved in cell wall biosynthesis
MNVTVIVRTYNRCQELPHAPSSAAASRLPRSVAWEVLVVDNNSNDQTREVVEDFCRRYPGRFRYLFEPQQGLSGARNAEIRESRSEILAFTDDDATIEPDWLWNLTSALHSGEWTGAGGRNVPVWPKPLPSRLSVADADTLGPFVAFDLGTEAGPLTRPPCGTNMAFRREAFEKYGDFRTDLGRSCSNLRGREDLEFANRLLARGERLRYERGAVVRHPVPESRMKKSYVLTWWYWYGRSEVSESGPPDAKWLIRGVPLYLLRRFLRWTLQSKISIGAARRFSCQRSVWYIAGTIVACYGRLKRPQQHGFRARIRKVPRRKPSCPGNYQVRLSLSG